MDRIDEPISPELALVDPDLRARLLTTEPVPGPPTQRRRIPGSLAWAAALVLAGTTIGVAHAIVGSPRPSFAPKAPRTPAPAPAPRPHPVTPRVREQLARPPLRRPAAHRPRSTPPAIVRETEPATGLLGQLPDPTPPELRLRPTVASALVAAAMHFHLEWPVLLAAARARGVRWTEASPAQLRALARRLRHERAVGEQASPEESALARYDGAVGLDALVSGLGSAKAVLAARVLRDPRIAIYPGGRNDIASGRVDVRVLAVLLYLAQAEGSVAVSSLVTGHEGPGGQRSAHDFGLAVDLRAVAGKTVLGHQTVGGPVEGAVRDLLLLPEEVRPLQIVSLLDLGGPSVALADHSRTVHVGFDPTVGSGLEFLWRTAGASYGVPWPILAAINQIETKDGTFLHTSPAGAIGWMQFMPGTWQRYGLDADGNGTADPWNPADAIFSAARYLAASGASTDLPRAILAYNHARWYLNDVLSRAQQIEQSPSGERS